VYTFIQYVYSRITCEVCGFSKCGTEYSFNPSYCEREGVKLVRCYSVINFGLIRKYANSGDQSDINPKLNGE